MERSSSLSSSFINDGTAGFPISATSVKTCIRTIGSVSLRTRSISGTVTCGPGFNSRKANIAAFRTSASLSNASGMTRSTLPVAFKTPSA